MNTSIEKYAPWEVYNNLQELIKYRGIETSYSFADKNKFSKEFNHYEYVTIKGKRNDKHGERPAYIMLFAPDSKYATKSPDFKKRMSDISFSDMQGHMELLIISEKPLTNFIKKQIILMKQKNPQLYIETHNYAIFMDIMPKNPIVQKHEIVPDDEARQFFAEIYKTRENIKKILSTDTAVVWLGARPGDLIKIHRISESACIFYERRIVVKG